jgi:hypothetical protein
MAKVRASFSRESEPALSDRQITKPSRGGWRRRIGGWIREFWSRATVVLGAVLFASVGLLLSPEAGGWGWLFSSWPGRIFLLGVVLTLVGNIAAWRKEKRVGRLQCQVEELEEQVAELEDRVETCTRDYYAQFRTELARILKDELGYGDTERISVYRHRGRTFQLLGATQRTRSSTGGLPASTPTTRA